MSELANLKLNLNANTNAIRLACSIRLIVPRNMRILAKLTARKLTFAQEELAGDFEAGEPRGELWVSSKLKQQAHLAPFDLNRWLKPFHWPSSEPADCQPVVS